MKYKPLKYDSWISWPDLCNMCLNINFIFSTNYNSKMKDSFMFNEIKTILLENITSKCSRKNAFCINF